jgi:hypothetical protein
MHKYVRIGKRNGKRKKKRVFSANWAGGEISAQPRGGISLFLFLFLFLLYPFYFEQIFSYIFLSAKKYPM